MATLPDDLLLLVLRRVSFSRGGFDLALVSRRWQRLSVEAHVSMRIREGSCLLEAKLLHELQQFPSLTALYLPRLSVRHISDLLLNGISKHVPHLTSLKILPFSSKEDNSLTSEGLCSFLERAPSLRSLCLREDWSWGIMSESTEGGFDLPNGLSLSHLEILDCHVQNVPNDFWRAAALKKLVLRSSTVDSIPGTLGALLELRSLSLQLDLAARIPPTITLLTSLRRLSLCSSGVGTSLSKIFTLPRLHKLELECADATVPPDVTGEVMSPITCLEMAGCFDVAGLPSNFFEGLSSLTRLEAGNDLQAGGVLTDLPNLEVLSVKWFLHENLQLLRFPPILAPLTHCLRDLQFHSCSLAELPLEIQELSQLEQLSIHGCDNLQVIADAILTGLKGLTLLHISCCQGLKGFPDTLSALESLQRMEILSCYSFICLPARMSAMISLRTLVLDELQCLAELPVSLASLPHLEKIFLVDMEDSFHVPPVLQEFVELQ